MSEDAIIVAIVFGSILGMITIPMLISLAKKWITRNNNSIPEESFNRLAKAFMEYKKSSERRLQNLEAITSGEDSKKTSASGSKSKQIEAPKKSIEVDDHETEEESQSGKDNSNLRNMLRE